MTDVKLPDGRVVRNVPEGITKDELISRLAKGGKIDQQTAAQWLGTSQKAPKQEMGEFTIPFEFSGRQAQTALGMMTTFDPKREMEILRQNYPDLVFSQDEQGNVIVDASAYGGATGYLNKPGISMRDIMDLGFQVVAFTPAAKAGGLIARAGGGMTKRMLATGTASAGTQAGMDLAGQAAGTTEDVSLENIDLSNVAFAGGGGAIGEPAGALIGRLVKRYLPTFRQTGVTEEVRHQFREVVREMGGDPSQVTDDLIKSWMRAADEATGAPQASMEAAQQTDEFGIPYTRGQAMEPGKAKLKQMELEDTLRYSTVSPKATETLEKFGQRQEEAISAARRGAQDRLGGPTVERPNQAGAAVREGVQTRASSLDDAISESYDRVGDAYLSPEGMLGLAKTIQGLARSPEFVTNPKLAPATREFLESMSSFRKMVDKGGNRLKPIHIQRLEQQRRLLNNLADSAANPNDRRQILQIKATFDRYLDEAIDNALFSGDPQALEALKEARGLRAQYTRLFGRKDTTTRSGRKIKDQAGDVMERIVSADPTDEEIANYLFGASKLGAKQGSAKLASRLKQALGADSDEWQQVRQAAFLKLTEPRTGQTVTSGQTFLSRIKEATEGSGETFMKELFTPDEIAQMKRLANAIKRAQPDPRNPSKTAYKGASIIREQGENLLRMLGFMKGGPVGGVAAEFGIRGSQGLGGIRKAIKAQRATQGVRKPTSSLGAARLTAPSAVAGQEAVVN